MREEQEMKTSEKKTKPACGMCGDVCDLAPGCEWTCPHCGRAYTATIETMRRIVRERQCEEIDGVLVDATTANVCVRVHDALNETNRAKFAALSLAKMVHVAWETVS